MPGEGIMSYVESVVERTGDLFAPNTGEGDKKNKSFLSVGRLTKTALIGGMAVAGYYAWRERAQMRAMVCKILGIPHYVLHVYDHCPFCIRVELAFAFLGVPYTRIVYGYGDLEGPKRLKGKKQLPVLEYVNKYTDESLDIIDLIEENTQERSIAPKTNRKDMVKWIKDTKDIRDDLTRPRKIKVPVKDWAEARDVNYAREKYEKRGFNYRDAEERSVELIDKMNRFLDSFNEKILYDEHSVGELGFGMDDIIVLPDLRTLTCVKGLMWPKKLRKYLENAFENTTAELYFDYAI